MINFLSVSQDNLFKMLFKHYLILQRIISHNGYEVFLILYQVQDFPNKFIRCEKLRKNIKSLFQRILGQYKSILFF